MGRGAAGGPRIGERDSRHVRRHRRGGRDDRTRGIRPVLCVAGGGGHGAERRGPALGRHAWDGGASGFHRHAHGESHAPRGGYGGA